MSRIIPLSLAALLLLPLPAQAQDSVLNWSGRSLERGRVQLRVSQGGNGTSNDWGAQELAGLDARFPDGAALSFRVVRGAGTLNCSGTGRGGRGEGECRFERSAAYFDGLRQRGVSVSRDLDAMQLALSEVPLTLLDELKRQDYRTPDVDELIGAGGISVTWMRDLDAAGYRQRALRDLIPFRVHGVDATFIRGLKAANPRLRPNATELVQFRVHNVTPAWVAGWLQLGYDLSPTQLVASRVHNVSTDYARAMMAEGRDRPTFNQFVQMRIDGVRPSGKNKD